MAGKPRKKKPAPKQAVPTTRNVPWGKYERSDWKRLPGAGRYYYNVQNPNVTITRRAYDEHYGSAALHGTYERKAKHNATSAQQLLRPARGRSSALKLTPEQREVELGRRKVAKAETKQQKTINKYGSRKVRIPTKITLRNFDKGHAIRKFATSSDYRQIEQIRAAGQASKIVFGYWVGLSIVDERDGELKTPTLFKQRDIHQPFTERDMRLARDMAKNKMNYSQWVGMWIALHLTAPAAKRNGVKK